MLKRSNISTDDLFYYYNAVILPVLEYGSVVWQASITEEQIHQLDSIQRRAERIIQSSDPTSKLESLQERRDMLSKRFFASLLQSTNCLHNILPTPRDHLTIEKLRHANLYPIPFARTERYKRSFLTRWLTIKWLNI